MRVLVCGGRDYTARTQVARQLASLPDDTVIITGGARGADYLAWSEAKRLGLAQEVYQADWDAYGKKAGMIRNQEMLDSGIDLVLAFPGGRGTADMVRRARAAGVTVTEVVGDDYDGPF